MSLLSHVSILIEGETPTVRLTFTSDTVAAKYSALSKGAWVHKSGAHHVTRPAADYEGFRAYRDAFCLIFNTPDGAQKWLNGQEKTLWKVEDRESDESEKSKSVSLRNGIKSGDLGMDNPTGPAKREIRTGSHKFQERRRMW